MKNGWKRRKWTITLFSFRNKGNREKKFQWKNIVFIGSIFLIIIIITILLLVFLFEKSNDNSNENDSNEPKDKVEIGIINCTYEINSVKEEVNIIGKDFESISSFDIYINGKKENPSKSYNFTKIGINTIIFKLYEDINMDNMFKNISFLISVEMTSKKKQKFYQWKVPLKIVKIWNILMLMDFRLRKLNQWKNYFLIRI